VRILSSHRPLPQTALQRSFPSRGPPS
jgi:hypothetical protein